MDFIHVFAAFMDFMQTFGAFFVAFAVTLAIVQVFFAYALQVIAEKNELSDSAAFIAWIPILNLYPFVKVGGGNFKTFLFGSIGACVAAGANEIVVHPFFLGPGSHTTRDIPRLVADAAALHPGVRARVGPPLGLDEKLVDLVLERIEQAP